MYKVLLVASIEKSIDGITNLIKRYGSDLSVTSFTSSARARRHILDEEWDLVLINHPLTDDDATELANMVHQYTNASIIFFTKESLVAEMEALFYSKGVIIIPKPVIPQVFSQSLSLATYMKDRISKLEKENAKIEKRFEEEKIITRAKLLLITKKNMCEKDAHKLIEKKAMNERITKLEVAKYFIRTLDE